MDKAKLINHIRSDFSFLSQKSEILGILLFGSYMRGDSDENSDIDLCVVAPNMKFYDTYAFIMKYLQHNVEQYDLRFFEELPLEIQGEIMDHGIVVYSPNESALYEYFYFSKRKEWEDFQFRNHHIA
jgi:predicted nucleotidyltransferase